MMVVVVLGVQTWKPASTWPGDEVEEPDKQGPEEEQVHLVLAPLVHHQPQQQPVRPHPVLLSHCLWCSHHESTFVIWVSHKSIAGHEKRYTYTVVVNEYPISLCFYFHLFPFPPRWVVFLVFDGGDSWTIAQCAVWEVRCSAPNIALNKTLDLVDDLGAYFGGNHGLRVWKSQKNKKKIVCIFWAIEQAWINMCWMGY